MNRFILDKTKKIALVTGANRGIGLEVCRQLGEKDFQVILTSRDRDKGQAAVNDLRERGLTIVYHQLDITKLESIVQLEVFLREEVGRLDALVNNAGIYIDHQDSLKGNILDISIFELQLNTLEQMMKTNFYGHFMVCKALVPLMKKQNLGRVVNVSSSTGGLSKMESGFPAYRMSKTALNALTRILATELKDTNILVNSACPGSVKTDMPGAISSRTVEQGADTIVWLATLEDDGPTGGFFKDRKPIPW